MRKRSQWGKAGNTKPIREELRDKGHGCILFRSKELSGFICGFQDHVCNTHGTTIYGFSDGYNGSLFDKAMIEGLNFHLCDDDKLYFLEQRGITILSGSVSCSLCGRPAIADAYRLDI